MIRKGDIYTAREIRMAIKILDFLSNGKIKIEYNRNGYVQEIEKSTEQLQHLNNPDLFDKNQSLF